MKVFITGAAGFIGFHLARRLLDEGHDVLGFDGITPYYDVALKRRRNAVLLTHVQYRFVEAMLEDKAALDDAVSDYRPDVIVHLAAQPGVRTSAAQPDAYVASNVVGTLNLLEAARCHPPQHLLFASTSSVYGGNEEKPFSETARSDYPLSIYAATKKAGEAMTHAYAHGWGIPTTCFRFFTVYGAWGRPDMALFKFVDQIRRDEPIVLNGMGHMKREVTHVGDLVEAVVRLLPVPPVTGKPVTDGYAGDSLSPVAPWRAVNIAGAVSVSVLDIVEMIEKVLGKTARKTWSRHHVGETLETAADGRLLRALTGYEPKTDFEAVVREFVDWFDNEWTADNP